MRTKKSAKNRPDPVTEGAVPAEELQGSFPPLDLPIQPPFPPMEAKSVEKIPAGGNYQYEPKWDGFRCLVFRDGDTVVLQSKAGQPLARYFPELVEEIRNLAARRFVIDGEIVIERNGELRFDDLLMRIHPAESRIRKLSSETPATVLAFDILVDDEGKALIGEPLSARRQALLKFCAHNSSSALRLSPVTLERAVAERWLKDLSASGFDGVIAKQTDCSYASGERTAMQKIKRIRTADCVVGGFRWTSKGGEVGSLLLGLYDDSGLLQHIGYTSSFKAEERKELEKILSPYMGGSGFSGNAPGGPSRWSTERTGEWERLEPKLVCEVRYDHFSGGRFRHGTKFLRWRPDKEPKACTFEQVERRANVSVARLFAA
ncbi:MAG TPA: ATP-dependent DNA ligase [Clostridia bacterium]|nr:ATP-dependent DNA ligase [Clostridia bacterium]